MKKYVLILMDGAADLSRVDNKTPLDMAHIPNIDLLTKNGVTGLMKTLYEDLPKGSIVSQLGIFGYDPYKYYPYGRASSEAKALDIDLNDSDIAFRANFSHLGNNNIFDSYNANYIKSKEASNLVDNVNKQLTEEYNDFHLYHNSDFRNVLVVKNADINPLDLECFLPHEQMGEKLDLNNVIKGKTEKSKLFANKLNKYIKDSFEVLKENQANIVIPWSPSLKLELPRFSFLEKGKCGVISHMDFLHGISKAIGIEFFKAGNGNWDTDYQRKGDLLTELLSNDYCFSCVHINAPDEAAHMGDIDRKIHSIEEIDKHIVSRVIDFFNENPDDLGGVIITTDHYTNTVLNKKCEKSLIQESRIESHTTHPVPFALWDSFEKDNVFKFTEDAVTKGKFAKPFISHLDLLKLFN